jgi:MOSC domain-containing protein YiiM
MSSIRAIAIKNRPRVAMQVIDSAQVTVANGILGDFRGAQQGRQITIMSESAWHKACAEVDTDLPWTTRRANLLVDEVEFDASYVGKTVRIGDVELMVTMETDPCSRMDAQHQGLTAALTPNWRGGICCDVIKPGEIKIGDQIEFD